MWECPTTTDEGVGFIYSRSVCAWTMSLPECEFSQIKLSHGTCDSVHHLTHVEVATHQYVLAPTPPLPVLTNSHPSTHTHLIDNNPPLPPTACHITQASQG